MTSPHAQPTRSILLAVGVVSLFFFASPPAGQRLCAGEPEDLDAFPSPRSAEDEQATFVTKAGLKIELVASEPLVVDPVAFDWDADGGLWVVEMGDYPLGTDGRGKPGGRLKKLIDTDDDGRYDKAHLLLDDLPFPTGVKFWREGALVTAAPRLVYVVDADDDGRADRIETLFEGFKEGNQQHRVNGLRWGIDNWLYLANGDSGGQIKSRKTGEVVSISGRDLRLDPDTGRLQTQAGRTQNGRNRDDWGNWFGGNNSEPLWHFVVDEQYLRRNPHLAPRRVWNIVPDYPDRKRVFPTSRTLARFNNPAQANHFTSCCSPAIYRDRWLGDEYAGNAFVCEPVHNLVHRMILRPRGYSFTGRRAKDEQESEFLTSSDNWFRPVMVRTGPDGGLWIADMYRLVIEHPEWIPEDWQRRLNLRAGDDRGRIWSIVRDDASPRVPRLESLDTLALVAQLRSSNGIVRDLAQQLLLWRSDERAIAPLRQLALNGDRPLARLHALATLDGLGKITPQLVLVGLKDAHPGVRRHAVRWAEPFLKQDQPRELGRAVARLAGDQEPQVRLQVAHSLGAWQIDRAGQSLARLLLSHGDDEVLRVAALSSVSPNNVAQLARAVLAESAADGVDTELVQQVLTMAVAMIDRQGLPAILNAVARPGGERFAPWQLAAVSAAFDALEHRRVSLDSIVDDQTRRSLDRLFAHVRRTAEDNKAPLAQRRLAIQLLGRAGKDRSGEFVLLGRLLAPSQPPEIQRAAVEAIGHAGGPDTAAVLLKRWKSATPDVRASIVEVLVADGHSQNALLTAIEKEQIPLAEIDTRTRQRLLEANDRTVRDHAGRLFAGGSSAAREKVVRQYLPALELPGDSQRGRKIFTKRCSACHKLGEVGMANGPDLLPLAAKGARYLLESILDPNRAAESRYLEYLVITTDGRSKTGMLLNETANSLTLVTPDGMRHAILRTQIEEFQATGRSFMPEGLERELTPQDLADVMGFIRSAGDSPQ